MHNMDQDSPILSIAEVIKLPEKKESKFNYEFQQLGVELEPVYGRGIWHLFYRRGFTEHKIRQAHEVCKKKNILTLAYLIGVVKRML